MGAEHGSNLDNDGLGVAAFQYRDDARLGEAVAHHADQYGDGHGDHHPHGGDSSGKRQFIFIFDRHKAQQDVGHAEIAKPPGQRGHNHQRRVGSGRAGLGGVALYQTQITGEAAYGVRDASETACHDSAEADYNEQGDGHGDALDQVGGAHGEKTAKRTVDDDDSRA